MDTFPTVFPEIETPCLLLTEIIQEHLDDLFRLFGDARVTQYYNIRTFRKTEDRQIYLDWFRDRFHSRQGIRWGIRIKGEEGIAGTIGYNNFTPRHRANIGYDLCSDHWNRGYMSEALTAVMKYGFETLAINRIEAEVMPGNTASETLLQKNGFRKEGLLREWMYWDDRHFDMCMYSCLRRDSSYF